MSSWRGIRVPAGAIDGMGCLEPVPLAAKVLEPPGPGVVEEGGQAPDHDDSDGDEVTSPCACEETFFNVNCISYV